MIESLNLLRYSIALVLEEPPLRGVDFHATYGVIPDRPQACKALGFTLPLVELVLQQHECDRIPQLRFGLLSNSWYSLAHFVRSFATCPTRPPFRIE
ncbi:uncharacterized protein G2W53_020606 [Senna tora]|uniref:Uncharacterized protein n=1 Tax=Senna tora TaxID=362788 RepID=A0A834THT9_9FABA|nr:uncharacterized protein G2W53_020606 [Senna tora]